LAKNFLVRQVALLDVSRLPDCIYLWETEGKTPQKAKNTGVGGWTVDIGPEMALRREASPNSKPSVCHSPVNTSN